jgi:hypothetical protein
VRESLRGRGDQIGNNFEEDLHYLVGHSRCWGMFKVKAG